MKQKYWSESVLPHRQWVAYISLRWEETVCDRFEKYSRVCHSQGRHHGRFFFLWLVLVLPYENNMRNWFIGKTVLLLSLSRSLYWPIDYSTNWRRNRADKQPIREKGKQLAIHRLKWFALQSPTVCRSFFVLRGGGSSGGGSTTTTTTPLYTQD